MSGAVREGGDQLASAAASCRQQICPWAATEAGMCSGPELTVPAPRAALQVWGDSSAQCLGWCSGGFPPPPRGGESGDSVGVIFLAASSS